MTDDQINKLNMAETSSTVLGKNNDFWKDIPVFVTSEALLKNAIAAIHAESQKQTSSPKGYTVSKMNIKQQLLNATLQAIGPVSSHAVLIDDQVLLKKISFSENNLKHSREQDLVNKARIVHTEAKNYILLLAPYGYREADLDAFGLLIDQFEAAIPLRRTATSEISTATKNLRILFHDLNGILRTKIDLLMLSFMTTQPDFYKTYMSSRVIVDLGKRSGNAHTIVSGTIVNFETEEPLVGVNVLCNETGKTVFTDVNGKYSHTLAEGGTYTFRAMLTNFTTFDSDPFTVNKGIHFTLDIDLEPEEPEEPEQPQP
jgi:hypothetical protein